MSESLMASMQPHMDGWKSPGGSQGMVLWPVNGTGKGLRPRLASHLRVAKAGGAELEFPQ